MNIFKRWRETQRMNDEFRALERALELPKNSIRSEYEKLLVLSGLPIKEVNSIHDQLIGIAVTTPFAYETAVSVHQRIKDIEVTKQVIQEASQRAVNPHVIIDLMVKKFKT